MGGDTRRPSWKPWRSINPLWIGVNAHSRGIVVESKTEDINRMFPLYDQVLYFANAPVV
jgi:hypothetical protein